MIFVVFASLAYYLTSLALWVGIWYIFPDWFAKAQEHIAPVPAAIWIMLAGYGILQLLTWLYDTAGYRSAGAKSATHRLSADDAEAV